MSGDVPVILGAALLLLAELFFSRKHLSHPSPDLSSSPFFFFFKTLSSCLSISHQFYKYWWMVLPAAFFFFFFWVWRQWRRRRWKLVVIVQTLQPSRVMLWCWCQNFSCRYRLMVVVGGAGKKKKGIMIKIWGGVTKNLYLYLWGKVLFSLKCFF